MTLRLFGVLHCALRLLADEAKIKKEKMICNTLFMDRVAEDSSGQK